MLCAAIICPSGLTQNVNKIRKVLAADELESDLFEQSLSPIHVFDDDKLMFGVVAAVVAWHLAPSRKVLSILFVHVNRTHFRCGRFCWAPFFIERC